MNEWQALMQIRKRLRDATWGSSTTRVFGDQVVVTAGPEDDGLASLTTPFLLLRPASGNIDRELRQQPGLLDLTLLVRLVTAVPGDPRGENALLGSNRPVETGSLGKGLLEVQEELFNSIKFLNENDGLIIQLAGQDVVEAAEVETMGYITYRDYVFSLEVAIERFYPPATRLLTATDQGGSAALITWNNPASRFDLRRPILRRASGATAPATHTSGTDVVLATGLPESHTDTPGVGQFSYSLFISYDDRNDPPANDKDVSSARSATVTVTT